MFAVGSSIPWPVKVLIPGNFAAKAGSITALSQILNLAMLPSGIGTEITGLVFLAKRFFSDGTVTRNFDSPDRLSVTVRYFEGTMDLFFAGTLNEFSEASAKNVFCAFTAQTKAEHINNSIIRGRRKYFMVSI